MENKLLYFIYLFIFKRGGTIYLVLKSNAFYNIPHFSKNSYALSHCIVTTLLSLLNKTNIHHNTFQMCAYIFIVYSLYIKYTVTQEDH